MNDQEPNTPANAESKNSSSWDWIWPVIMAVIIVKLFGIAGGLAAFGIFHWLKPKIGTWGAVAASGVLGAVVGIGLAMAIRA